ncbi:transporter substrate-binding domain-containing protein [bacterium]|nr:transporter substrate-binding domain-containing protein [bacterium]
MKRFLINISLILMITIVLVGCGKKQAPMDLYDSIQQRGKLVVGIENNIQPFSFKGPDGKPQGFEIDIAKQIAKAILTDENAVEYVIVEPATRISMLNSGKADMLIATMTITKSRANVVDFSEPYYYAGQTILVKRNSKIKTFTDLNNKRVGVTFGTTAIEGIKTVAPGAQIQGFKTYQEAYNALKADNIDAFASDDTILLGYSINDANVKILQQRYTQEPYGIAFRKGTESERAIDIVNSTINIMKSNGTMTKLKSRWFKPSEIK